MLDGMVVNGIIARGDSFFMILFFICLVPFTLICAMWGNASDKQSRSSQIGAENKKLRARLRRYKNV